MSRYRKVARGEPKDRPRVLAVPVVDGDRLGLRFVESGRIVYLTGDVEDGFLQGADSFGEQPNDFVVTEAARLLPSFVPRGKLLKLRPEDRLYFLRKPLAHLALLHRRGKKRA